MLVLKFGGSSLDCAASILRAVEIVHKLRDRGSVVVVSAMAKTTENLLQCARAAAAGASGPQSADNILHELRELHWRESHAAVPSAGHSALGRTLARLFGELQELIGNIAAAGRLTPRDSDAVASYGELLSSAIFSSALSQSWRAGVEAAWIDCRQVIVTDDSFGCAGLLYSETEKRVQQTLLPQIAAGRIVVLGGYVGATPEGITTTLGREGSDFTAAIVGAALRAEEIQIWTDVDGMMTADPRLVSSARRIRTLSFVEALELSCSGSPKPHYRALDPASRASIPIRILNSHNASNGNGFTEGTLIGRRSPLAPPGIKSISYCTFSHRISLRANGHGNGQHFGSQVAALCRELRPALMTLSAASDGFELAVKQEDRFAEIQAMLERIGKLEIHPAGAVLTMVSEDLATSPALVRRAMEVAHPLAPSFVTVGAACACVRCLVSHEAYPAMMTELHQGIFGDQQGPIE